MKPGYSVKGKIESDGAGDPVNKGQLKGKVGLNLSIYDETGKELDSERVISEGLAYTARFGFKKDGKEVILFEGKGASDARFPAGHNAEGKAVPNPGYIEEGCGISAIEHSNGLRMFPNFKQLEDGIYEAFGTVDGVEAKFPGGNTIGFGKAAARKGGKP